jgi:drug/metabolite transporter (DMT)-like permease
MRVPHFLELLALAALWGASFLFMRLGAHEFGPVAFAGGRVLLATALLLPLLAARGQMNVLATHWKHLAVVGLANSAMPFALFAVAALAINAGLSSVFNATAPLWGAVIAWLWLHDKPNATRTLGLTVGFAGVVFLAWDKASLQAGAHGVSAGVAIAACLLATLGYGFAANYTKRFLQGVPPLAAATGSQLTAALVLAPPAAWMWPAATPSATAWWSLLALAVLCTALAYLMYFRLIANIGPAKAITVTFLIPAFAVLWGALFLNEALTLSMALGCAVILLGTGLVTGVLRMPDSKSSNKT